MRNLEDIATDLVGAWGKWAEAPGWDNNEYDALAEFLNEMEVWVQSHKEAASK